MLNNISFGQYIRGESFVHKLDPRTKFLVSFIYMIIVFATNNYVGFSALAIFTAIIYFAAKIPLKTALNGVKPVLLVLVIAGIINVFTIRGTTIFTLAFLTATYEGVYTASVTIIRIILMVMEFSVIIYTTTPIALTDGIEKLFSPFKKIGLPVHEVAMMMTIALRFIPTIIEEADKIMKAQLSRGAGFEDKNIIKRVKSYLPILIPLFVNTFRRADELAVAMEARCYRGSVGRTKMKNLKIMNSDIIFIVFVLIFSCLVVLTNYIL